ncbi:MAG: hypothetical protein KGJ06_05385 [Pseudomonadota bacterium]|nr:hypothetical protein [Pseudomonadota bacterium]
MSRFYNSSESFFERAEKMAREADTQDGLLYIAKAARRVNAVHNMVRENMASLHQEYKDLGFMPPGWNDKMDTLREKERESGFAAAVLSWLNNQAVALFLDDEGKPLPYDGEKMRQFIRDAKDELVQDCEKRGSRLVCFFPSEDERQVAYGTFESLIAAYYGHHVAADTMMNIVRYRPTGAPALALSVQKMAPILERECGLTFEREAGEWLGY